MVLWPFPPTCTSRKILYPVPSHGLTGWFAMGDGICVVKVTAAATVVLFRAGHRVRHPEVDGELS